MNQLSEEVLRLDTRIDNVSDDLDTLENKVNSLNNDAINQRVNDIANAVDNNTSIVNSMNSRITDLENAKQDVMSARSVQRSIEISEIQEIHEEIHTVAMAVDNLDASVSPKVIALENQASNFSSNISNLQNEDKDIRKSINDMDVEHHEELHRLSLAIDGHESRINNLETHWVNYEGEINDLHEMDASINNGIVEMDEEQHRIASIIDRHDSSINSINNRVNNYIHSNDIIISELQAMDSSINNGIVDMDKEHHEELNRIDMRIDNNNSSINSLTNRIGILENNYITHLVMTEAEYEAIENPDPCTFYFTYEEN